MNDTDFIDFIVYKVREDSPQMKLIGVFPLRASAHGSATSMARIALQSALNAQRATEAGTYVVTVGHTSLAAYSFNVEQKGLVIV